MKIIEYFNPQSSSKYVGGIASLFAIPLFHLNTMGEIFFVICFSLMFILFGIIEGYNRNKKQRSKR